MKDWRPVDFIVALLAVTIASMFLISVISATIKGEPMSERKAESFAALVSSIIAIISIYVGAKLKGPKE